jgi:hypothetical protein
LRFVSAFVIFPDFKTIIQSESLQNFSGCTPEQQNQIYNALDEAIDSTKVANRWIGYSGHSIENAAPGTKCSYISSPSTSTKNMKMEV